MTAMYLKGRVGPSDISATRCALSVASKYARSSRLAVRCARAAPLTRRLAAQGPNTIGRIF